MTISYSTNWMGPIALSWYRERDLLMPPVTRWSDFLKEEVTTEEIKHNYMGGRIDVHGTELPYGDEIGLPLMSAADWNRFSVWLDDYETKTMETLDKILESYYNDGNSEIEWWKDNVSI